MSNPSRALRDFTYGLYVVTTEINGEPKGAVVSFVTQVSFSPKAVAVGLRKGTAIHDFVRQTGRFVLHVLSVEQKSLAESIYKSGQGADLPQELTLGKTESGLPLLRDALSWVEVRVTEEAGEKTDHRLFIGEVVDGDKIRDGKPASLFDVGLSYGG